MALTDTQTKSNTGSETQAVTDTHTKSNTGSEMQKSTDKESSTGSHTITGSGTDTDTQSLTLVVPPPVLPSLSNEAIRNIVVSTEIVSILGADCTTAMQARQLEAIMRDCPSRQNVSSPSPQANPVKWSVGSERYVDEMMGSIIFILCTILIVFVLLGCVTLVYAFYADIPFWTAAETLGFPGYSLAFSFGYVQDLMTSSLFVLVYSRQILFRVVAAFVIFAY